MAISIGSNVSALRAERRLADGSAALAAALQRLGSGMRINAAADDAAGLAIAESLRVDSRVYSQAVRNVSDGVSVLNIAEGALLELSAITMRQMELAEQSANGVYSLEQRTALNAEANALGAEFNRIVQTAEFNGRKLLDVKQSNGELRIQLGYGSEGSIGFGIGDELARTVGTGAFSYFSGRTTEGSKSYAIALGDLDGDGDQDAVTTGVSGFGATTILLNQGNGSLQVYASLTAETYESSAVSLSDIDGNGALDLVTAGGGGDESGYAIVRLGNGNGTFRAGVTYTTEPEGSWTLRVQDVNSDGVTDLLTGGARAVGGSVTVRLGCGDGTFSASYSYTTGGTVSDLALGDVNGDNILDLLAGGDTAELWLGAADGTFYFAHTFLGQSDLAVGDLNSDGRTDVVTAGGESGEARVWLGNGDGTFRAGFSYATEPYARDISVHDINGDGIADMVTAGSTLVVAGEAVVTIRLGNDDGTFRAATSYNVPGAVSSFNSLALGDMNNDGAPDVVAAGYQPGFPFGTDGTLRVFLGRPEQVTTVARLDLFSQESSRAALITLQAQLLRINNELGAMGSIQSRFSTALRVLQSGSENSRAAAARISDADVAAESAIVLQKTILQQASAAVLAQAKQEPQIALLLLGG